MFLLRKIKESEIFFGTMGQLLLIFLPNKKEAYLHRKQKKGSNWVRFLDAKNFSPSKS